MSAKINLDIELLRTLVAYADSGSFKGASQLVYRSQPAVSMQMKRLQRLTGLELFERQGREVALTEHGMQMVLNARKLLAAHDRMVSDLSQSEIQGEVRIGLPDDYAPHVLPHMLRQFSSCYPGVLVNILANTTPVLEANLMNGELDLAVVATLHPDSSDIVLAQEAIVWVSSPEHDTHVLRPLNLALFSDESPIYRATMGALKDFETVDGGALQFHIGVLSKSSAVLIAVAASGFAVATMAKCVAPKNLRILGAAEGFPDLGHVHIVIRRSPDTQSIAASRLMERISDGFLRYSFSGGEEQRDIQSLRPKRSCVSVEKLA